MTHNLISISMSGKRSNSPQRKDTMYPETYQEIDSTFHSLIEHILNDGLEMAIFLYHDPTETNAPQLIDLINPSQFEYVLRTCDQMYFYTGNAKLKNTLLSEFVDLLFRSKIPSQTIQEICLRNLSKAFLRWMFEEHLLILDDTSLWLVFHKSVDWFQCPSLKEDVIDLHPLHSFTNRNITYAIYTFDRLCLKSALRARVKLQKNTDKYLLLFLTTWPRVHIDEESGYKRVDILHELIYYYFTYPVYLPNETTPLALEVKIKNILRYTFMSGDPHFVEFALHFILSNPKQTFTCPYSFLFWTSFPRDLEVYRRASVYPISTSYAHSLMGYMLMYYQGEDPNLLAISRQFNREYELNDGLDHNPTRRMSEFTLE